MGWLTDPYYEKGKAEGFAEGFAEAFAKAFAKAFAEAEAEGAAEVLARILEKRFGEIPAGLRQRLFDADVESLEVWVDRAFDAPNLEAVFEPT